MSDATVPDTPGDEPPATPDEVAHELGAAIDAYDGHEKKQRPSMLHSAPRCPEIEAKSALHGRCRWREHLVIGSILLDPRQRDDDRWPYRHYFLGSLSPVNLSINANLEALRDGEAVAYYRARARTTKHTYLAFRYHDFAGLFSKGRDRFEAWSAAVDAGITAFNEWAPVAHSKHSASDILLRSLEIATILNNTELVDNVCAVIVPYIDAHLLADPRIPTDLIHGYATVLPKGRHVDFASLADRLEKAADDATSGVGEVSEVVKHVGSPYGPAWGVAKLSKDGERVGRVVRKHVQALIAYAEKLASDGSPQLHVMHWYQEAWAVLTLYSGHDDLREAVRRGLQNAGARIKDDLRDQEFEVEIPQGYWDEVEAERGKFRESGPNWPVWAAGRLLRQSMTEEKAQEVAKQDADRFIAYKLFGHMKIEDDRTVTSDGEDWRHKASGQVLMAVMNFWWPHKMIPSLREAHADGLVNVDVLIGPFIERGLSPDIIRAAESAAYCQVEGDHVAATQLWCLLIERILRFVIVKLGGSTTAMDRDGQGQHEAAFDAAVEEFKRLVEKFINADLASRLYVLLSVFLSWRGYGQNWRNRVAHGTMEAAEMSPFTSYTSYLLCVVTCMFLVARSAGAESGPEQSDAQKPTSAEESGPPSSTGKGDKDVE